MSMVLSTESCFTASPRSAMAHVSFLFTRMFLDFRSRWAMAGFPVTARETIPNFDSSSLGFDTRSKNVKTVLFTFVTIPYRDTEAFFEPSKALLNVVNFKRKLEGHFCFNIYITGIKHKKRNWKLTLQINLENYRITE